MVGVEASLAVKPKVAVPPGGRTLASTQPTVHPYKVNVVGLVTVTWPWNPPGQVVVME